MLVGLIGAGLLTLLTMSQPGVSESLELKVRLESEAFTPKQKINIGIEIINVGDSPIAIFEHLMFGDSGTLDYVVRKKDGSKVPNWVLIDSYPKAPDPPRVLASGESVKRISLHLLTSLVPEPGSYVVEVSYLAPNVPTDDPESEYPIWTRESGPLTGTAEFEVVEEPN